jgi:ABC-2 type transport system ATP-binding protein
MSDAIVIKDLSVILGGRTKFKALQNITINLPQGQIVGFIGPSGAGKTTLIRCIVGRQKLSVGSILIFDQRAGSAKLRPQVSYMTQERSVYPDLSVSENLHYFATMFGLPRQQIASNIDRILTLINLKPQANQLVTSLSGGQKQRVSLAIALIGQPKLMVLDEPTVGLDPLLREQLWRVFHTLRDQGTTLIISSHVMEEAERCDDLLLIRDGQLLAHGSPAQLCQQTQAKTVEQAFLAMVEAK